jgi:tRNA modification GTPase
MIGGMSLIPFEVRHNGEDIKKTKAPVVWFERPPGRKMTAATYAACLTPPGTAAIAVLAVRGPAAWDVVRKRFAPISQCPLPETVPEPSGPFWLGHFGDPAAGADEVVLSVQRREPPWVEIHCHGGRAVVRLLLETLTADGVVVCTWQELERHTSDDALRSEAMLALAETRTTRTAAILLDQYHGALGRALQAVDEALARRDTAEAGRLLGDVLRYSDVGSHLTRPWRVVIAGAPNVGKSSLVNALAGYERCLVSEMPGTTRDVVTTVIALDGWPIELADTAGVRQAAESLEKQGIDLAQAAAVRADLCLWVLDAGTEPVWPTFSQDTPPLRYAVNKIDLPTVWDLGQAEGAVRVSARSGEGLDALCSVIVEALVPEAPPAGQAVPFTPELCGRLEELCNCCTAPDVDGARRWLRATMLSEKQNPPASMSWRRE